MSMVTINKHSNIVKTKSVRNNSSPFVFRARWQVTLRIQYV